MAETVETPDPRKVMLEGTTVVLGAKYFRPEYQALEHRLAIVTGGFGACPSCTGRAVFVKTVSGDDSGRVNRGDIDFKETAAYWQDNPQAYAVIDKPAD